MDYDVAVLGAGAAGLFCAFQAARRGRKVVVLEHNARPGRKILISGGGRCNFTNRDARPECFVSDNAHFAKSALVRYLPQDFISLVDRHSIAWHEKHLGQLFCNDSAQQILELLLVECRAGGVVLLCDTRIHAVRRVDGFEIETSGGILRTGALVVATGGPSIPKMGATGFAYDIARQFGLRVIDPRPALVPLTLTDAPAGLAGVSCGARTTFQRQSFVDDLLFTHRGLSGPAVLQISTYWRRGEPVLIDLHPSGELAPLLIRRKHEGDRAMPRTILSEMLPARMASHFAPEDKPLSQWTDAGLRELGRRLQCWEVFPSGTEGFAKAEVTAGGVDTRDLSSQTMEARRVPGLFFIGECVDVTGWLGGYNFQWAWSSAYAASQAV